MTEDKAQPHVVYILSLGSTWSSYLPVILFCAQITKPTLLGKATCEVGLLFFVPLQTHSVGPMLSDKGSKYLLTLIYQGPSLAINSLSEVFSHTYKAYLFLR